MGRNKDELELLGFLPPRAGEDPRTGDNPIDIVDNGAFRDIENLEDDFRNPVDVEQDPFLPQVTDDDGVPGYRPFVDASAAFEQEQDLNASAAVEEQEIEGNRPEDQDDELLGDDLASKMRARQIASVGRDGRPVSDLALLAGAAHVEQKALIDRAPYRRITPESAVTGMLGGQIVVPLDSNGPRRVIQWVGEDIDAIPCNISLYPVGDGIVNSFGSTFKQVSVATITWGTRDGVQSAKVDVGTGVQVTVVASSVYVDIDNARYSDGTLVTSTPASVSASLGFFTGAKNATPTLTEYLTGAPQVAKRPPYASHVYFERERVADQWTLLFRYAAGVNCYRRVILANTYLDNPVKLADDVEEILVTNDTSGAAGGRLMWGLYL